MGREYKISCEPLKDGDLQALLLRLPSPIQRPEMWEIYSYSVDDDGYYFVDHLVDRDTAARALIIFVDAALSKQESITISES